MPEEKQRASQTYNPSQAKNERILDIYNKIQWCIEQNNKPLHYFNEQSKTQWTNESEKRWISYVPHQDVGTRSRDWRASVFMPETRNKVLAILSFIASQRMRTEVSARSTKKIIDKQLSSILSGLYEYSMDQEGGDKKFFEAALECIVKGTVIIEETYLYKKSKKKELKGYDFETGIAEYVEKERIDFDNCYQKVRPIEDVFIPDFYEADIQKQPYIIIRELINESTFRVRYKKYADSQYVCDKSMMSQDKNGDVFFFQHWGERLKEKQIEVLHYYNKEDDIYNIVANGVLLTKLDSPIIFDHKKYPFVKAIFEPFASNFFFGMSLPMKLGPEQNVLNTLYNMFLDRTYLSVMPFFITSLTDEIEESSIGPMQRIHVSDASQFREAQVRQVGGGEMQMMNTILQSLNRSSVDPSQQGQTSSETATAVLQARESAVRLMGLFINFLGWMTYEQAVMRFSNILQFYAQPNLLKNSDGKLGVKEFRSKKQVLSDGTTGIQVVRMVDDEDQIPDTMTMKKELLDSDDNLEVIYITPKRLQNIDYLVKIVPNSSIPETKALKKALAIEYAQFKLNSLPELTNREKISDMIDEVFDQNPEDMKIQQQPQDQNAMMQQLMQGQGAGQQSQNSQQLPQITQQLAGQPQKSAMALLGK